MARGSELAGLKGDAGSRPYKQVARAQARQRTREALVDAALEEFFDGDWDRVSLETLAGRAGVTKQTLLRHFGSKDGLLMQAIASRGAESVNQRWSTPQGDVRGAVENVLDHYEQWGERSLRIGAWLQSGPPALAQLSRAARQLHYNWIEYAFEPQLGRLRGQERARCRAALIVLCDVQSWWLLSNDLGFERAEILATLAGAIEGLLGEREK
jgi:AcrR family transcriptional regulator